MKFLKALFQGRKRIQKIDLPRRFDLIGRTGQGSMSKVWRARDSRSGQIVALKVLDLEKTRRFEARFTGLEKPKEGEVAITLKHPNIVRTREWGLTLQNEQFLVMDYIEGVSLSFLVDMQNELMQSHRLDFIIQLGDAVEYFHRNNWIHRDICPRNVMVSQDQQVKLIDFGLVVPNTAEFRRPGNRTGTANYMATELIKRKPTDQRIDIFSYAITCYEMYTRQFPWPSSGASLEMIVQHINNPPEDIRTHLPDIDSQVAETIMKGLANSPDDRWQNIGQMTAEFRSAAERLGAPLTEAPPPE